MKTLIYLLLLLASLSASANTPNLIISAENSATSLEVYCVSQNCESISIQRKWDGEDRGIIGPFERSKVIAFLNQQQYEKIYMTHEVSELKSDPAAGGLNIFLPIIKAVAYAVTVSLDGVERLTDQNEKMKTLISQLDSLLVGRHGQHKMLIGPKEYQRLEAQFEMALKNQSEGLNP